MKLREACELAKDMGCVTIEEAILNTELHCIQLFYIDDICDELTELREEYAALPPWMLDIDDLLER